MKQQNQKQPEKIFVFAFFVFFAVGLFLGDGKQQAIDVFAAAAILFSYGLGWYRRGLLRPIPRHIHIGWAALIVYSLVRTIFSDSVGYSITATMRTVDAYLIFSLFYSIASERALRLFAMSATGVSAIAVGAAALFLFVPSVGESLPSMNLLYRTYGHNHLVDLAIFALPIVFLMSAEKKDVRALFLTGIFLLTAALSFARGAWLLLAAYFFWCAIKHKKKTRVTTLIISVVFVGLFFAWSFVLPAFVPPGGSSVRQGFVKPGIVSDPRIAYWREALRAVFERPLLGSGPGTFYLDSKRLQVAPGENSWFAHSFPLETLAELGGIGFVLWAGLVFAYGRQFWRMSKRTHGVMWTGILSAVVLTIIYGFYEFNLNFMVIWLLVWASAGLLMGTEQREARSGQFSLLPQTAALFLLGTFYVLVTGSATLALFRQNNGAAFLLAPFEVNTTIRYILSVANSGSPLPRTNQARIAYFHRRDPEVLFAQARLFSSLGDYGRAKAAYEETILLDPKNGLYQRELLSFLVASGRDQDLVGYLGTLCHIWSPGAVRCGIKGTGEEVRLLAQSLKKRIEALSQTPTMTLLLPKVFYFVGLDLVAVNPFLSRDLWRIAAGMAPQWGYYWVELAALERWTLGNPEAARDVLVDCSRLPYAAPWCFPLLQEGDKLPRPGTFEKNIEAIPKVLPWANGRQ